MSLLFPRLAQPGDDAVIRLGDAQITSRQLAAAIPSLELQLSKLGIARGSHVAVWTEPTIETLISLVALAASGFVVVPIDPKLGPLELGHILKDAAPAVALGTTPSDRVTTVAPQLSGVDVATGHRQVDDAPLLILYTSGTTGLPKGAIITARNVAFDLDALGTAWKWTREDTVVHALPMFHVHGLVLGLFGSIRNGAALRWFPRFVAKDIAAALGEGTTVFFAVPTMYHRLSEAADGDPSIVAGLRHARLLVSGSAALPQRDQQRIESLSGRRVIERYGLTETIINTAVRVDSEPSNGSVGAALEGVELKLVDDQRQTITAHDDATLGEVAVRGPNVFQGYLNRPDATAAVKDADGWFFTGDIACMRPDGSVRIVGRRATDLIKCGGYKVGAGEVEAALLEHPHVREAAVVGRPDADLGERIVAFVVLSTPTAPKALEDFVAAQLSPHKRPREVHVLEALPRNAMGKILKTKLLG